MSSSRVLLRALFVLGLTVAAAGCFGIHDGDAASGGGVDTGGSSGASGESSGGASAGEADGPVSGATGSLAGGPGAGPREVDPMGGAVGGDAGESGESAGGAAGAGGEPGTGGTGGSDPGGGASGLGGAPGATTYDGDWDGSSAQGKAITFRVSSGRITYTRFGFSGTGVGCTTEGTTTTTAPTPIAGMSFTQSSMGSTLDYTLAGMFASPSEATGTLSFVSRSAPGTPACNVQGQTTWTASKLPPEPSYDGSWVGETSTGNPISLIVADNTVASVSFGYSIMNSGGCSVESTFSGGRASPIISRRADLAGDMSPVNFSGSVTFDSPTEAGGTLRVFYFDTSTTPPCTGTMDATFTVIRE